MVTAPPIALRCGGCGTPAPADEPYPFRCPRAGTDGGDHVMTAVLDPSRVRFPTGDDPNPFVRYRELSYAYALATSCGMDDTEYVDLVRALDRAVARVDGRGFVVTPFARHAALSAALGSASGGIWVKDETGNVSGSHKGRHLMGLLIYLEVVERLGLAPARHPDLAIASCGNAALGAAVVARAGDRRLRVFVPVSAPPSVVERLRTLEAQIVVCPREPGVAGDPTYHALQQAIQSGAIPFTCQGPDNGLTIDGGKTLGYEIVSELTRTHTALDRIFIQVGGGALASACVQAFQDAVRLEALPALPRIHAVQTECAHPLARAYERVVQRAGERASVSDLDNALAYAAAHRREFMWPWEEEPRSVASGILDDETYDWLAVVRGMVSSHGSPVLVSEDLLREANALAVRTTGINVDETGSAGLAGLLALHRQGALRPQERAAVLFTGIRR